MITWPASLPCSLRGKQRTPVPNVIAFGTEVGSGKVRRRSTARGKKQTFPFVLSRDQVAIFEAFFEDDLRDGALSFRWADPVTLVTHEWRFDVQQPYSLAERPSGKWSLDITLDRIS